MPQPAAVANPTEARTTAVWVRGDTFHAWGPGMSTGCGEPIQDATGTWERLAEAAVPERVHRCYLPGCWGGHQTPVRRQYRQAA